MRSRQNQKTASFFELFYWKHSLQQGPSSSSPSLLKTIIPATTGFLYAFKYRETNIFEALNHSTAGCLKAENAYSAHFINGSAASISICSHRFHACYHGARNCLPEICFLNLCNIIQRGMRKVTGDIFGSFFISRFVGISQNLFRNVPRLLRYGGCSTPFPFVFISNR